MKTILNLPIVAAVALLAGCASVQDTGRSAEGALERGARAAAEGLERGAQAAAKGVRIGVEAAARGVEKGAQAVARGADRVAGSAAASEPPKQQPNRWPPDRDS